MTPSISLGAKGMGRLCDSNANCTSKRQRRRLRRRHSYAYTQRYTNGHSYGYSDGYSTPSSYSNSYSYALRPRRPTATRYCTAQRNSEATCHCQANALLRGRNLTTEATTYTAATPLSELAWRFWGAHALACWFRRPRRNELSWRFVAGLIEYGKRSPRWRGRHRQHAGRVRSPEYRV